MHYFIAVSLSLNALILIPSSLLLMPCHIWVGVCIAHSVLGLSILLPGYFHVWRHVWNVSVFAIYLLACIICFHVMSSGLSACMFKGYYFSGVRCLFEVFG